MKLKTRYVCGQCAAVSPSWRGQCAKCGAWNTLREETAKAAAPSKALNFGNASAPVLLDSATAEAREGRSTGFALLDELLGKGFTPGSAVLFGGEPGVGKSTLLLQIAGRIAASGRRALYVTGEESLRQLRERAERLKLPVSRIEALATNRCEDCKAAIESGNYELVVADSVQTLATNLAEGGPGGINQVRAVSGELIEAVKKTDSAVVLVGHVTKDGQIAGPKLLEHMVDAVLYLEGDRRTACRILRVLKNRFGPTDDLAVFQMTGLGLEETHDPSTFFLDARDATMPGSAVGMVMDGRRPFAVEVQALAAKSFLAMPRRTALGFDVNRLHVLLAVLEKRLRVNFGQTDVYAKIGGGLSPKDPGLDAALAAALLSSLYDKPLPEGAVFWGEIDLNGRLRPSTGEDIRARQAARLGYGPIVRPKSEDAPGGCGSVAELAGRLFRE